MANDDKPIIAAVSISELPGAIRVACDTRTPGIYLGPPGVGKTEIIKQTTASMGWQYTEVVLRDIGDAYMPFVAPSNGRAAHLEFHYAQALPIDGNPLFDDRPILLNLDEFTTYNRLCQNLMLKVLDEWRIGEAKLRDDVVIVGTGNRIWDHAHTEQLSSALGNRGTIIHFDADVDFWINYALSHDFHPLVIAWVRFDPTNLFAFDPKAHMAGDYPFPSPRSNEKLSRIMHLHDRAKMSDRLFRAQVCGTIGMSKGTKFAGYIKIQSQLPNFDAILAGKPAKVPDDPSVLYASLYALIQRSNRDNLDNVCKWIDRIPPEMHLLFTKLVATTKPALIATQAWSKWLVEHTSTIS
jgi:hypothetical protein